MSQFSIQKQNSRRAEEAVRLKVFIKKNLFILKSPRKTYQVGHATKSLSFNIEKSTVIKRIVVPSPKLFTFSQHKMYKSMARRKHTYLHKVLDNVEPSDINRRIQSAMTLQVVDPIDFRPTILPPASMQPACFAPKLDRTKAELAYGHLGIPKLVSYHFSTLLTRLA